jgi:hypothetical protein
VATLCCASGAASAKFHTTAATTLRPLCNQGTRSTWLTRQLAMVPVEGPLATRRPLTNSTKRWSAVTVTGSESGTRASSTSRRK